MLCSGREWVLFLWSMTLAIFMSKILRSCLETDYLFSFQYSSLCSKEFIIVTSTSSVDQTHLFLI